MSTFVKVDIISFLDYGYKNRRAKKIHNQSKRLANKLSGFPGNKCCRQEEIFEIRQYYNVFMNLK